MSPSKSKAVQTTAKAGAQGLATQYRAIGPAAVVAALICATRKKSVKPA